MSTMRQRLDEVPEPQRMQVDAVAAELRRIGSYQGSESDSITDAIAIVAVATFAPPLGDNHHNANACPHCQAQRAHLVQTCIRCGCIVPLNAGGMCYECELK